MRSVTFRAPPKQYILLLVEFSTEEWLKRLKRNFADYSISVSAAKIDAGAAARAGDIRCQLYRIANGCLALWLSGRSSCCR
jgi:hypothetical protein